MQALPHTPAKGWAPGASVPAGPVPAPAAPPAPAPATTSRAPAPKEPAVKRVPGMSAATAQRRITWNIAALAVIWAVPYIFPRIIDLYYDVLIALDDNCEACHIEFVDVAVAWLRGAFTIVLAFNVCEALVSRPAPPTVRAPSVGEALARGAKALPAREVFARPALLSTTQSPAARNNSPRHPSSMRGSQFEGRRSLSPFQRASSTFSSPRALDRGTPATPFASRASPGQRTPSIAEAFAGRSSSRSPMRSPAWTPNATADDDELEVERALEQLHA